MSEIVLKNIEKIYPGQEKATIPDYNLKIHDKEFVVFVGPSGSGKSTVLRMIAGLSSITSGTLTFDGKKMNNVPPKDRGIAMVFQDYALYPHMTVFDNIAFPLKIEKKSKDEIKNRVEQIANLMGLGDFLKRKPADLSGGQRQRVAIAGAIVRGSKILLMDEPLSNLDAKLRVQARSDIAKIHKTIGSTTIYVTHDQTEAMTLADRIVLIDHGVIQQIGTPDELYNKPANLFVGTFIGSPEMNIFPVIFDGKKITDNQGLNINLPNRLIKSFNEKNLVKKKILFGIRPEDIYADPIAVKTYNNAEFESKIELSELLGESVILHVSLNNDKNIMVKTNQRFNQKIGSQIKLAININKAHFFKNENRNERII